MELSHTNHILTVLLRRLVEMSLDLRALVGIQSKQWIEQLQSSPRAVEPGRLLSYGRKFFSQNDEDGIIQEIFQRIGTVNKKFIEFGVADGLECNSRLLLMDGWTGLWIDGSEDNVRGMREREGDRLTARQLFITANNIDPTLGDWANGHAENPAEIDLLSIDIDGNDYWVWQAIESINPRVVVIEYNASFPPPIRFLQPYRPDATWNGSSYYGASLDVLVELGTQKGYSLVGCCLAGVNAFFVRNDLLADSAGRDRFHAPYTAAEHYEPPRYEQAKFLRYGHPAQSGPNACNEQG